MSGRAVDCAGCASATADDVRYGKPWCSACVASLEFEERVARQSGMVVADVVLDNGQFTLVLVGEDGRDPSSADYDRAAVTEADVLVDLLASMAAFRKTFLFIDNQVRFASADASRHAERFLDVVTKYEALLGRAERESLSPLVQVARSIIDSASPNTNLN